MASDSLPLGSRSPTLLKEGGPRPEVPRGGPALPSKGGQARRPKLGLVLSGGGARGYAHLGIIRALQRYGLPIDFVVGTSMGAIVGAGFAAGHDLERLEQVLAMLNINRLLDLPQGHLQEAGTVLKRLIEERLLRERDWRSPDSPYQGHVRKFCQFFRIFTKGKAFEELRVPFAAVATDIDTGERVVIRRGEVCKAITVSAIVPHILYPVEHEGRYLVDGGVVDNLPVDVAVELGADAVLAIDISSTELLGSLRGSIDILSQLGRIVVMELERVKLELAQERLGRDRILVLRPPLQGIQWFDFAKVREIAKIGEEEVRRHLREIRALVEQAIPERVLEKGDLLEEL